MRQFLSILVVMLASFTTFSQNKPITNSSIQHLESNYLDEVSLQSTSVTVDVNSLFSSEEIKIDVPGFLSVSIIKSKRLNYNEINVWRGKIEGEVFGYTIFTEKNNQVFGKIIMDNGRTFMLKKHSDANLYELKEIVSDNPSENCLSAEEILTEGEGDTNKNQFQQSQQGVCDMNDTCNSQTMSLLIFFTPDSLNEFGTPADAEMEITLAVDEMNFINSNTGVSHIFTVADIQQIAYSDSGSFVDDLNRLRNASDGFIDEIHDLRDEYYADAVSMILQAGGCGRGSVNTNETEYSASGAFSVVSASCMLYNFSLAHEVGHNLGFRHNRYSNSSSSVVCNLAYGYVNENATANGGNWRTVMAYNAECSDNGFNCTRLPYFSNPDNDYQGDPMGIPMGNQDQANNKYILDRAACQFSQFRTKPCEDCDIFMDCSVYNLNTPSGTGNTTDFNVTGNFNSIPTTESVELCVYYFGDHSSSNEQFNIIAEDNSVLGQTLVTQDCGIPERVCFQIPAVTYNAWIQDGNISVSLDPITGGIDPTLCSNTSRACIEILVDEDLSVDAIENEMTSVKIYPNPTEGKVSVQLENESKISSIEVFTVTGQKVKNQEVDAEAISVSLENLSQGVYFFKINGKNASVIKKVIKQ